MSERDDGVYLRSILDGIAKIEKRIGSGADPEIVFESTVFHLITIGEAASKLSAEIKAANSHVPWAQIIAHRNMLVHNYLGIDEGVVNNIVRHRLPELKRDIKAILKGESIG